MYSKFSARCGLFMLICLEVIQSTYLIFSTSPFVVYILDRLAMYILSCLFLPFCISCINFYFFIIFYLFLFLKLFLSFPLPWLSISTCLSLFTISFFQIIHFPSFIIPLFPFFISSFYWGIFFLLVIPLLLFMGLRYFV